MLLEHLQRLPPDTIVWINEADHSCTAADLLCTGTSAKSVLAGKKVALWMSDPELFARAAITLDGSAASLLFLPVGMSAEAAGTLCSQFSPDVILVDDASEANAKTLGYPTLKRDEGIEAASDGAQFATRWVLPTSGTTGQPKLVAHTFGSLTRTAKRDPLRGRAFRWAQLYEMGRFVGLQVFLNSFLSGSTLILTRPREGLPERITRLRRHECNAISATPTLWRKILMTPESCDLRLRQITLGGEIADQNILNALHARYPEARICHIYASTEGGVGFSVNDGQAGFPRMFLEEPPAGLDLRVNQDGCLLIRPPVRDQTYLTGSAPLFDEEGFVNTGDLVTERGGRFLFLGRANGAINVGGNKVPPEEVEAVLHNIPGVRLAKVYGKPNSIAGNLVAADIQLDPGITELGEMRRAITSHCSLSLADFKVPVLIRFVDEMRVNETGKVARR